MITLKYIKGVYIGSIINEVLVMDNISLNKWLKFLK